MTSLLFFGATEGGLFDFDATLPLMALQVVLLTFILNSLFFRPVGKVVEDRESYLTISRAEAKRKLEEVKALDDQLKLQLKQARQDAQRLINDAEQDSEKLYREALALATNEANALRENARKEIDSQRESAFTKLKADSEKLGDLIVERLLAAK